MSAGALVPLVAALVVQAGYTVISARGAADDGLDAKARDLAGLMVSVTGPNIAFDDDKAVASDLGYVANEPDFAFAAAIRADGRPIAFRGDHVDESTVSGLLAPVPKPELIEIDQMFVAAAPVITEGKQVGTLFVGLHTDAVRTRALHMSEWASGISVVGILIAVIVVLVLARKIVERSRAMRVVLDNVDEALATIRRDGTLEPECSAAFQRWFGAPGAGPFFAQIAGDDARTRAMLALGWSELVEGVMPLEVLVDQFPSRLERGGRHFRMDIKPLQEDGDLNGALLRIRDITTEVEAQKTLAAQREYVAVFERALADPHGVREFIEDTGRLVAQLPASFTDPTERKRAAHTIKGNAATYGVASVAEVAHRLEDAMIRDAEPDPSSVQELVAVWTAFASRVEHLLGAGREHIDVTRTEIEGLADLAERGGASVVERLRALTLEPVAIRFENIRRQIMRVAANLDKPTPEIVVEAGGVRLAADRLRPFWGSFAHIVRNALDHGVESADERIAAGKPAVGRISLQAKVADGMVTVEITDDGRGIAWDRVRDRARAAGLPVDSQADLERALFSDGVTTADEVTETSGRGLGLAAVQAVVQELGGHISVTSESGCGARFAFAFPAAPVRPRRLERTSRGAVSQSQEIPL